MHQSRSKTKVTSQGHQIHIFADLSPSTILNRRALKPLLTVLAQQDIKYWWASPFSVKFALKCKTHSFTNLPDRKKKPPEPQAIWGGEGHTPDMSWGFYFPYFS